MESATSPVISRKMQTNKVKSPINLLQMQKELLNILKTTKTRPSMKVLNRYSDELKKWDMGKQHEDYYLKMELDGLLQFLTMKKSDFIEALAERKMCIFGVSGNTAPPSGEIPFELLTNCDFVSPVVPMSYDPSIDLFSQSDEKIFTPPPEDLLKLKNICLNIKRNNSPKRQLKSMNCSGQMRSLSETQNWNIKQIDREMTMDLDDCQTFKQESNNNQSNCILSMECDNATLSQERLKNVKKASNEEEKCPILQDTLTARQPDIIFSDIDNQEQSIINVKQAIANFRASYFVVLNEITKKMYLDETGALFDPKNEQIIKDASRKVKKLKVK